MAAFQFYGDPHHQQGCSSDFKEFGLGVDLAKSQNLFPDVGNQLFRFCFRVPLHLQQI